MGMGNMDKVIVVHHPGCIKEIMGHHLVIQWDIHLVILIKWDSILLKIFHLEGILQIQYQQDIQPIQLDKINKNWIGKLLYHK